MYVPFAAMLIKSPFVFFGASLLVACGVLYIILRKPKNHLHREDESDLEL
jgi:hypothetical protein